MKESSDSLEKGLYQHGNHPDGVRAICPKCERVALKDTETEAWEVVDQHNEQHHDGDDIAGLCEWDVISMEDMVDALRENMDDREYLGFLAHG